VVDAGVARRLAIPTVTTVHGPSLVGTRGRFYEWLDRQTYRWFDAVVTVSRALADKVAASGVSPERIHVVPNAWTGTDAFLSRAEARRALGIPARTFTVGWVGRLIPIKGPDVLVDVVPHLSDVPMRFVIVGGGPERDRLEARTRALEVQTRVNFVGQIDNAAPFFAAFDVFVLSSRSEGTPIALFEAMAAQVPVVAARVGGVPDVLTDDAGYLVPPGCTSSLSRAIRHVFSNPSEARIRAARAMRRLHTHFGFEPWLARYESVYRCAMVRSRLERDVVHPTPRWQRFW
jgi:glycosyltransferase involved in cell wall biosynthesis